MAMTTAGMSAVIKSGLDGAAPISTTQQLADVLAIAIVNYIKNNAVVPTGTFAAPAGGGPISGASTVT